MMVVPLLQKEQNVFACGSARGKKRRLLTLLVPTVNSWNIVACRFEQLLLSVIQCYSLHTTPERPLAENFCTRSEYLNTSNSVFNFNFLALVVSEIIGGPKFTLGALRPLDAPQLKNSCIQSKYVTISNRIFNFNFLVLVDSEIIGGPTFKLGGPAPLNAPQRKKQKKFCTQSEYFTTSISAINFNFLTLVVSETNVSA